MSLYEKNIIKNLITEFGLTSDDIKNYQDKYNNNLLLLSCFRNKNIKIIKFLVEKIKIDTNLINIHGDNCVTIAIKANAKLNMIKYLIKKINKYIFESNKNKYLFEACYNNKHLSVIKYLIDDLNINYNFRDKDGNRCLEIACMRNSNIEIIKYFIEEKKMNINYSNIYNQNCLDIACIYNPHVCVLKYLINKKKMIIKDNCLLNACFYNSNLSVIKYLVEKLNININYKSTYGTNIFIAACLNNQNLNIFKYLIDKLLMDINYKDFYGYEGPELACEFSSNIDVVKYLIFHPKNKKNIDDPKNYYSYLKFVLRNRNIAIVKFFIEDIGLFEYKYLQSLLKYIKNTNTMKYLIENNKININDININFITSEIKDYLISTGYIVFITSYYFDKKSNNHELIRLSKIIKKEKYDDDKLKEIIDFIIKKNLKGNIITNNYFFENISYSDLLNLAIQGIKININNLESLNINHRKNFDNKYYNIIFEQQFIKDNFSFKINGKKYYCNKTILCSQCQMISQIIKSNMKDSKEINLIIPQISHNNILVYLTICYTCNINILNNLEYSDLIELTYLIDQYPLNMLNINNMEYYIAKKYEKNADNDEYLKKLCHLYELRYIVSLVY